MGYTVRQWHAGSVANIGLSSLRIIGGGDIILGFVQQDIHEVLGHE